jgi:hypothetical protein
MVLSLVRTVDCWLLPVECMLWDMNFVLGKRWGKRKNIFCYGAVVLLLMMTVDCWLLTVECILCDMNFVLGKRGGQNIVCHGAVVLLLAMTVDYWLLIVEYWLLLVDRWLLPVDCWLSTVNCWLSTVECIFWDMNFVLGKIWGKGQHCLLGAVVLLLVRTAACWLLTVDCWLLTLERWLLTLDCWLVTVDCRMDVMGHELRFGTNRRAKHCSWWCCESGEVRSRERRRGQVWRASEIRNLERMWNVEGKRINFWEDNCPLFEGKWHQKFREDGNFWGETDQLLRG